jgi:hypothetical protein
MGTSKMIGDGREGEVRSRRGSLAAYLSVAAYQAVHQWLGRAPQLDGR